MHKFLRFGGIYLSPLASKLKQPAKWDNPSNAQILHFGGIYLSPLASTQKEPAKWDNPRRGQHLILGDFAKSVRFDRISNSDRKS